MEPPAPEKRPLAPAFIAFAATAGLYFAVMMVLMWIPLHVLGARTGVLRLIGGLLLPAALLLLGWRQRGRGLALHALLVAGAFAGALLETEAQKRLLPAPLLAGAAARALPRFMAYAYAGAALHAAILNAVRAFRASRPGDAPGA